jgi:hypothetical protein
MLTRTARTGCGRDKVIFACGPCRSVAPQGMRPQSPADRRIWPVPCRDARPRATNLRAGRSTAGNATHAEEDQPSRGTRTGCSAPLSCDELAIDPQRIVGRECRAGRRPITLRDLRWSRPMSKIRSGANRGRSTWPSVPHRTGVSAAPSCRGLWPAACGVGWWAHQARWARLG